MTALFICWILFVLVRFCVLVEGQSLSPRRYGSLVVLHVLSGLLFFQANIFFCLVLAVIVALDSGLYLVERRLGQSSSKARSLSLLLGLFLIGFFFIEWPIMPLREMLIIGFDLRFYAFVLSLLLCLKESNFFIRWFFRHYKLVEKVEAEKDAPATANGRIIGNLERLLLMFFLWEGAIVAATFIVAVKGLARFKKMEEHQAFAEYVIIGTFLSVLITLLIYRFCRLFAT